MLAEHQEAREREQAARRQRAEARKAAAAQKRAADAAVQQERQQRLRTRQRAAARAGGAELTQAALTDLASAFRHDQRVLGELGAPWAVAAWAPDLPPAGGAAPASTSSPWAPASTRTALLSPTEDAQLQLQAVDPAADDDTELASYRSDTASWEGSIAAGGDALVVHHRGSASEAVVIDPPRSPDAFCSSCVERGEVQLEAVGRATLLRARPFAFEPLLAPKGVEDAARERLQASGFLTALSGAVRGAKRGRDALDL